MPVPRDYTIILNDLVQEEILDSKDVLKNLLNWLSEDDVYEFCCDEYNEIVNIAYLEKYDIEEESLEEDL